MPGFLLLVFFLFQILLVENGLAAVQATLPPLGEFCSPIPTLPDGGFYPPAPHIFGQRVIYTCSDGFVLNGKVTSNECSVGEGGWLYPELETVDIMCTRVGCSAPPNITNGIVRGDREIRPIGFKITYSCNRDFFMTIPVSVINECQEDYTWSLTNNNLPSCVNAIPFSSPCPPVPTLINGASSLDGLHMYGQTVNYTCNSGFELIGNISSNTCHVEGGVWSLPDVNNHIFCSRVGCSAPPSIMNGIIKGDKDLRPVGFTITYACMFGFSFITPPPSTNVCEEDYVWSRSVFGGNLPMCNRTSMYLHCPPVPTLINGASSPDGLHMYGQTVNYTCNSGFKLIGNISSNTCHLEGGVWSLPDVNNHIFCSRENSFVTIVHCLTENASSFEMFSNLAPRQFDAGVSIPLTSCNEAETFVTQAITAVENGTLLLEDFIEGLNQLTSLPVPLTTEGISLVGNAFVDVEKATIGQLINETTLTNVVNLANNLIDQSSTFFSGENNIFGAGFEMISFAEIFLSLNNFIDRFEPSAISGSSQLNFFLSTITVQTKFVSTTEENNIGIPNYADIVFDANATDVVVTIPSSTIERTARNLRERKLSFFSSVLKTSTFMPTGNNVSEVVHVGGNNMDHADGIFTIAFKTLNATQSFSVQSNALKERLEQAEIFRWSESAASWEGTDCTKWRKNLQFPEYNCTQFNSFAVFFSSRIVPTAVILSFITWIGGGMSILCLSATIVIYLKFEELRRKPTTGTLINVCVCLLVVLILYNAGVGLTSFRVTCDIWTALLHYMFMCTWSWMCVNAYQMYKAFTTMTFEIPRKKKLVLIYLTAYGVPLAIAGITYGVSIHVFDVGKDPSDIHFESAYRLRQACWLHNAALHYGFLLPVGLALSFNFGVFGVLLRKLTCQKVKIRSTSKRRSASQQLLNALTLIAMMGLTWIFGYFLLISEDTVYQTIMQWLYTVSNLSQGVAIFVLNCIRRKNVRRLWLPCTVSPEKTSEINSVPHSVTSKSALTKL